MFGGRFVALVSLAASIPTAASGQNVTYPGCTFGGTQNQQLGHSLAIVGDANLDGVSDFAIGRPGGGQASGVLVCSGVDCSVIQAYFPASCAFLDLGTSVSGLGDTNGNGLSETLTGSPGFGCPFGGRVELFDQGFLTAFNGSGGGYGSAVAGIGDSFDGADPDFIIGAPGAGGTGRVELRSGDNAAGYPPLATIDGAALGDSFGAALAGLGDADFPTDGKTEFLVGAPGADPGGLPDAGRVSLYRVFLGVPLVVKVFNGASAGDSFGTSVGCAGDVNGDGTNDILVGAPQADPQGMADAGQAYVYSGRSPFGLLCTLDGAAAGDNFGISVAGLGDIDCDETLELIVGAYHANAAFGQFGGEIRVFSVTTGGICTLLYERDESPAGASNSGPILGFAVAGGAFLSGAGGGDVTGDGIADVLYAAPHKALPNQDSGLVTMERAVGTPAGSTKFGVACAGSGGFVPQLNAFGGVPLATGNPQFGFCLSNALGGTGAALVVGFNLLIPRLSFGPCTLYETIDLLLLDTTSGVGPGQGSVAFDLPIPPNAIPPGFTFYVQGAVADPGPVFGPSSLAMTSAMQCVIQ